MNVLELEKELKSNIIEGIYLLYGEETYLLETSLKKLKKLFGEIILRNKLYSNRWYKCRRINIKFGNASVWLWKKVSNC